MVYNGITMAKKKNWERVKLAQQLRKEGKTAREIAKILRVDHSMVVRYWHLKLSTGDGIAVND